METFPTEITRLIISHIGDKRTLAVIARCGSRYRALAESILYHSLRASKRHLPRHAHHYTTYPHLAVYLRVLRVLDEERGTQSVENAAADSVGKILELAVHLEEVYFPSSTNGAHGHIFERATCFNLRILRCHFRDSEREICQFVAQCLNLEDLELTASFGERDDGRILGSGEAAKLLLPLENHHNLRRLCLPAKHMMKIREGMWLRRYTDKSNKVFGYPQMVHLSGITGNMLQMLDVENLPEDPEFLYLLADMLPNLHFLATPWVFTDTMYEPILCHTYNSALLDVLSKLTCLEKILLRGNHDDERQPNLLYDFMSKLKKRADPGSLRADNDEHKDDASMYGGAGTLTDLKVVMIWAPASRDQWGTTFVRGEGEDPLEWREHLNVPMALMDRSKGQGSGW